MQYYNVNLNLFKTPFSKDAIRAGAAARKAQEMTYNEHAEEFYNAGAQTTREELSHKLDVIFEHALTIKNTQVYNDVTAIETLRVARQLKTLARLIVVVQIVIMWLVIL